MTEVRALEASSYNGCSVPLLRDMASPIPVFCPKIGPVGVKMSLYDGSMKAIKLAESAVTTATSRSFRIKAESKLNIFPEDKMS